MPKLDFRLEEDKSSFDSRSNEFAFVATVKNVGGVTINLISLQARKPNDAILVDITNPSSEALKEKYDRYCKELERILVDYLEIHVEEIQKKKLEVAINMYDQIFEKGNTILSFLKVYFKLFSGQWQRILKKSEADMQAYTEQVGNLKEAKAAFHRWLETSESEVEKKLYQSKMEALDEIEKAIGKDIRLSSLATVEPESFFSQTYIFRFSRDKWEPRKYNVSVDGTFTEDGNPKEYSDTASASLTISPDPRRLTILAMFAGVLGAVVKYCTEISGQYIYLPLSFDQAASSLQNQASLSFFLNSVIAVIGALVFFNVYERTDIGKKIDVGVSWRSALLIGLLSGLLGERMIAALKAFIP